MTTKPFAPEKLPQGYDANKGAEELGPDSLKGMVDRSGAVKVEPPAKPARMRFDLTVERHFPISAGIFFGLGLGGFFDGIVLHQILQWHHMVTSAGYPANNVPNLEFNTLLDGLFHAATYIFVITGLAILWSSARRRHLRWSTKLLIGTVLIGFGIFNLVEGTINHQLLGLHHVNETVPSDERIYWDFGFLTWGAAMLLIGLYLLREGDHETA